LHGVLEVVKNHNINLISVVSPSYKVSGKRVVAIRIETHDHEGVVKELEQKGFEVLSVNTWPSKT
jgi:hypothetical protein